MGTGWLAGGVSVLPRHFLLCGWVHSEDICCWTSVGLIELQKGVNIEAFLLEAPLPPFFTLVRLLE